MNLNQNNIIIGIDTSCYTTSIAAISLQKNIILNEKITMGAIAGCLLTMCGLFLSEKNNFIH